MAARAQGSCVRTLHGGPLPHTQACCRGGAPGEPVASSPQTVPRAEEEGGRGGPGVAPTLSPGLAAEGREPRWQSTRLLGAR